MLTQRTEILAALAERGWRTIGTADVDWWADEILVLESTWSPTGGQLFLAFLVDPQHDGPRAKGEAVWAVTASRTQPTDRAAASAQPCLSLGSGYRERLPAFVQQVDALR